MKTALFAYHALLLAGLATMLIDGWGWVAFAVYSVGMPVGALVLWRSQGQPLRALRLTDGPGALRRIVAGFALAGVIPLAILGVIAGMGWADIQRTDSTLVAVIAGVVVPQIAVAAAEELAFRGVTQALLTKRFGETSALAISAALFGVFHLPNALYSDVPTDLLPLTIGTLMIMGWVFGDAFRRTGHSLGLPIALHLGWNIASFGTVMLYDYQVTGARWLVGDPTWFPESGLLGSLGLIIVGILVARQIAPETGLSQ